MRLKDFSNLAFQNDQKFDFLFPVGATEQHGPFLPFGTDTYVTDYLVDRIEKEFPHVVILPALEFSRSREHRGFFGTLWLTEETLERVLLDVCNSIKDRARRIFIYSFHANGPYIDRFLAKHAFPGVEMVNLQESDEADCAHIEADILKGPLDGHAGNSEISNMLFLRKDLVTAPPSDYPKRDPGDAFGTDDIAETCPDGIADPHPLWKVSEKIGKDILDVYADRIVANVRNRLT